MKANTESQAVPLVEEELQVHKRLVTKGRVRVHTTVETIDHPIREVLKTERVEVTRVPVGQEVQSVPEMRTDGDVTVVPVVEEVVVVEKRLVLKEELHIRKITTDERVDIPVQLHREHAVIERDEAD